MSRKRAGAPLEPSPAPSEREAIAAQFTIDLGDEASRAAAVEALIPQLTPGARLRLARRGRGLSQGELGRVMRRTRWTVARWERSGFPARQLRPLAEVLGVPRRWLAAGMRRDRVPGDGTLPPGLAWEERLELAAWAGTRHGLLIELSCDEDAAVRKAARETLARLGLLLKRPRRYARPRRRRRAPGSEATPRPGSDVPSPTSSDGSPPTSAQEVALLEMERKLRARCHEERTLDALWDLIQFYRDVGREDVVRRYLQRLVDRETDLELRAFFHVSLGCSYERTQEMDAAVEEYRQAVALEPVEPDTAYFAHNNLAYCLNLLGEHEEAERLCRLAITIEPARANAYKNLGVSLEGLGDYAEAAEAWVCATRVNPGDPRALRLLEDLVAARPELFIDVPGLEHDLDECRRAVQECRC